MNRIFKTLSMTLICLSFSILFNSEVNSNTMQESHFDDVNIKMKLNRETLLIEENKEYAKQSKEIVKVESEMAIKKEIIKEKSKKVVAISRGEKLDITRKEYVILCRISASETTSGNLEQKMNAIQCVLNRVKSESFPDSIEGVVFAHNQFSVLSDGRYYSVDITDLDREAVDKVLSNPKIHKAVYFKAEWCESKWFDRDLKHLFSDGMHDYYNAK